MIPEGESDVLGVLDAFLVLEGSVGTVGPAGSAQLLVLDGRHTSRRPKIHLNISIIIHSILQVSISLWYRSRDGPVSLVENFTFLGRRGDDFVHGLELVISLSDEKLFFDGIILGPVIKSYQIAQVIVGLGVGVQTHDNFGVVLIDFILRGLPDGSTVGLMGGIFVTLAMTLLN
jgi:hypothetical protein